MRPTGVGRRIAACGFAGYVRCRETTQGGSRWPTRDPRWCSWRPDSILWLAVNATLAGISIQTIGIIFFLVGVAWLLIELVQSRTGARRQRDEPTNNPAERALRGPVIHRKLSHGTRSEDGERFATRALTAAATCHLQDRSLFAYLR